ncbi:MAG: HAMP domain-containing sensor histidine kinase [Chromatiales bacterium]|jgi:signal transduction histidine kinase
MKFSDILASTIHDMKNSLSMVINTLDELLAEKEHKDDKRLSTLQHESKRLNNNLIALLSLYKIENERLSANVEEINVADFLEEVVIDNQTLATARGISLEYTCDDMLVGYFDEWLIRGVLNNLIGNGLRYTSSRILIRAETVDDFLVLRTEDDGSGFPQSMIDAQASFNRNETLSEGQTQLGIYFAAMVAKAHKNGDKMGYIELSNGEQLTGGCSSVWLP